MIRPCYAEFFVFVREGNIVKWTKLWVIGYAVDMEMFWVKLEGSGVIHKGDSEDLLEDRLERYKSWNLKLERTELRRVAP